MLERNKILQCKSLVDQQVVLYCWINSIRHHGKVSFCDLRDESGKIQAVFVGEKLLDEINNVSVESVIKVFGKVVERQANVVNEEQPMGGLEIFVENFELISKAELLPFSLDEDTKNIDEKIRMQYRYLDLRSDRMQDNIRSRHEAMLFLRNYYSQQGFIEVETPCLTKGTPEGAREFVVPSRPNRGSFYVLPQSPQQFKQLLMVGGMGKYFQVARCFRDEDHRQDRQPEFTQFDLEMSFVDEEDIMQIVEDSIIELVSNIFPNKKILSRPFPKINYAESMKKYGNDKPDLREEKDSDVLAFCWVTEFPLFEKGEGDNSISSAHHPFTKPREEDVDLIDKNPLKVRSTAFDLVLNGYEISSGSVRIHDPFLQKKIFTTLGLKNKEIEEKFGHMIKAFGFGVPPHGGTALGMDRLIAAILGEESIREVIAFPKTGEAKDLLMGAPSILPDDVLKIVGIKTIK